MNVYTTCDTAGIPEGSFIRDCTEVFIDGSKYWEGTWSSMAGTYQVQILQSNCEITDDE